MRIVLVLLLLLVSVPRPCQCHLHLYGRPVHRHLDLTFPPGTFDTSMRVTGSFELANPLPANLPLTDIGGDVLAFSFSNGRSTLTDADPNLTTFFFVQTNTAGDIDVWDLILQQALTLTPLGDHDTRIVTQNDTTGLLGLSGVQDLGALLMCDPANVPRGLCIAFEDSRVYRRKPRRVDVEQPAHRCTRTLAGWVDGLCARRGAVGHPQARFILSSMIFGSLTRRRPSPSSSLLLSTGTVLQSKRRCSPYLIRKFSTPQLAAVARVRR